MRCFFAWDAPQCCTLTVDIRKPALVLYIHIYIYLFIYIYSTSHDAMDLMNLFSSEYCILAISGFNQIYHGPFKAKDTSSRLCGPNTSRSPQGQGREGSEYMGEIEYVSSESYTTRLYF